jgi:hypothetical protein
MSYGDIVWLKEQKNKPNQIKIAARFCDCMYVILKEKRQLLMMNYGPSFSFLFVGVL